MDLYMIRRRKAWRSPAELEAAAKRSTEVAEREFPDDISWIRSYVVGEESDELGSVCIYRASSADAVRSHAERVGMPADEVLPVVDTVIARSRPQLDGGDGSMVRNDHARLARSCAFQPMTRAPNDRTVTAVPSRCDDERTPK